MNRTYFKNFIGPISNRLDWLIQEGKLSQKQIVLFGLNSSSYVVRDYLLEKGISVTAYIDNSKEKCEKSKEKVPAFSPEQLRINCGENVAILITSKYYIEMRKQLEQLGYIENEHIFQIIDVHNLEQYVDFSDVADWHEISAEELRIIQMKLLKELKRICEENQLRYYLTGGTLLGEVRHKGYIPWDDDIDVVMPMCDYKKFIKLVNEQQEYVVLSSYTHSESFHGFYARMVMPDTVIKTWDYPYMASLGVNIDIFPLYGVPEDKAEAEKFAEKMEELNVDFREEFIKRPKLTEKYFDIQEEILKMMDQYPFDSSTNIAYLLSRHKKKEIMPREIYRETIMAEFEDDLFAIPGGYDDYLRRLFGDKYMELPPEEERCSVHNFRAFVKDLKILEV